MEKKTANRFLSFALIIIIISVLPMSALAADYEGHWSSEYIVKAKDRGWMNGYEDGTFRPNKSITRAEFSVMLWRALGSPAPQGCSPFTDVADDIWYGKAVTALYEADIVLGYGGGLFGPGGTLTREMAFATLARAFDLAPESTGDAAEYTAFDDYADVSSWAADAASILVLKGYVEGVGGNLLMPKKALTRGEMAKLLIIVYDGEADKPDDAAPLITLTQSPTASTYGSVKVSVTVEDESDIAFIGWRSSSSGASYTDKTGFIDITDKKEFSVMSNGWYAVCATDVDGNFACKLIQITNIQTSSGGGGGGSSFSISEVNVIDADTITISLNKDISDATITVSPSLGTVTAAYVSATNTYTVDFENTMVNGTVYTVTVAKSGYSSQTAAFTGVNPSKISNVQVGKIGTAEVKGRWSFEITEAFEADDTIDVNGVTYICTSAAITTGFPIGSADAQATSLAALLNGAGALSGFTVTASGCSIVFTQNVVGTGDAPTASVPQASTAGTANGAITFAAITDVNAALGDCSVINKVLVITANGAAKTITFYKDYTSSDAFASWDTFLDYVNAALGETAAMTVTDSGELKVTSATTGKSSSVTIGTDDASLFGTALVSPSTGTGLISEVTLVSEATEAVQGTWILYITEAIAVDDKITVNSTGYICGTTPNFTVTTAAEQAVELATLLDGTLTGLTVRASGNAIIFTQTVAGTGVAPTVTFVANPDV